MLEPVHQLFSLLSQPEAISDDRRSPGGIGRDDMGHLGFPVGRPFDLRTVWRGAEHGAVDDLDDAGRLLGDSDRRIAVEVVVDKARQDDRSIERRDVEIELAGAGIFPHIAANAFDELLIADGIARLAFDLVIVECRRHESGGDPELVPKCGSFGSGDRSGENRRVPLRRPASDRR